MALWAAAGVEALCGAVHGPTPELPVFFIETTSPHSTRPEFLAAAPHLRVRFRDREQRIVYGAAAFTLQLPGASPQSRMEPLYPQSGTVNMLFGSDPGAWQQQRQTFGELAYRNLYPGIDLICRFQDGRLKSDFIVAPGADPGRIRMHYAGVTRSWIDAAGALQIQTAAQGISQPAPVLLQSRSGKSIWVRGGYRQLGANTFGFSVAGWDRARPLIIDPLLTYSTLLGGSGVDSASSVAVDASGNIYLAGWTDSNDFRTVAPGFGRGGGVDAFVAKLDPTGARLLYCTYLGGSGDDRAMAIAVDASGNAYIAGMTSSANFPVLSAFQPALNGVRNAFIVKLNAAGAALFSTYFGGSGSDTANAIALGPAGGIYFAGGATSTDLPIQAGLQPINHGQQDAFVAQLAPSGTTLVYSTYAGGAGDDSATAIAVDSAGAAYIAGATTSPNFPVVNALQPALKGMQNAFVMKLAPDGQSILYSTYLGGSAGGGVGSPEMATGLAVDAAQNAYITGVTSSNDFPVFNAIQPYYAGQTDAFVVKLTPPGQMAYGTYLGGAIQDYAAAIAVDASQNVYVAGYTASSDFPMLFAVQSANAGLYDAFVTKLDSNGRIAYSTYLGAAGLDSATGIRTGAPGQVYVVGQTQSLNFPTAAPLQAGNGGLLDAFLAVLTEPPCSYSINPTTVSVGTGPGSGSVAVTTGAGCGWTAAANAPFLGVVAGSSGMGPGVVSYSVAANTGSAGRTGSFSIAGQTFAITQAGAFSRVGVFRQGFLWILDVDGNHQINTPPDRIFALGGVPGDIPISGDWNGDGSTKAGIYRSSSGLFLLDYSGTGQASVVYNLGVGTVAGDVPVVGDWNGNGKTKVGLFRQGFLWILDYNGNGVFEPGLDRTYALGGIAGDVPVVGDWNGSGTSKMGLFRQGYLWILDYNGNGVIDAGDKVFPFGGYPGDVPLVGDWTGSGTSKVGIFRQGFLWVLDANGNYQIDSGDYIFGYAGYAGDKPVIGKW